MLLYPAVVAVIVGVTPADELAHTETPILTAAAHFLGSAGTYIVAGMAVLALVSMANSGVIASARYPFAMARNSLAPPFLAQIGQKSGAPVAGIAVTGAILSAPDPARATRALRAALAAAPRNQPGASPAAPL